VVIFSSFFTLQSIYCTRQKESLIFAVNIHFHESSLFHSHSGFYICLAETSYISLLAIPFALRFLLLLCMKTCTTSVPSEHCRSQLPPRCASWTSLSFSFRAIGDDNVTCKLSLGLQINLLFLIIFLFLQFCKPLHEYFHGHILEFAGQFTLPKIMGTLN